MGKILENVNSLVGKKFCKLTISQHLGTINKGNGYTRMVMAICECGIEKKYNLSDIKYGGTKSCGCLQRSIWDAGDILGKKFGRLTVTEYLGILNHRSCVTAVCECGNVKQYELGKLKKGVTQSCGCLARELSSLRNITHGLSKHPLYKLWHIIQDRCYNENCENYYNYGGRGVTVCDEWRNSFMSFYKWCISNGWKKGLQIDKDKLATNKGGGMIYSPEYCCFLTPKENMWYTRTSVILEYNNEKKSIPEWGHIFGFTCRLIRNRLRKGWTIEEALETPKRDKVKNCETLIKQKLNV